MRIPINNENLFSVYRLSGGGGGGGEFFFFLNKI